MSHTLVELIRDGTIQSITDLKTIYRKMLLKTHPDAIGSDILLERYLEIRRQYEEATRLLSDRGAEHILEEHAIERNHRLEFFRQWDVIETLEMPYAFHPEKNKSELEAAKQAAFEELVAWKPEWKDIYKTADAESVRMKQGIPLGPYLKHAMGLNVRPLVHNIIYFNLTGRTIYQRQAKQNFGALMYRLEQEGFPMLKKFLVFLVEDMKNGPTILE